LPNLTFIQADGKENSIYAENGLSIMEVARDNNLGIEGTCGGSISCCTCHVVVDPDWFSVVGKPDPDEEDMLDLAFGLKPTSRLGCQIEITDKLDGLRILIPEE
jgi:2Fe-2S ferredoxin